MFKRQFALALVFGMAATAPPALAQQMHCAERDSITNRLASHYNESQNAVGLQSANRLIEIWSSDKTGSWTILVTLADGTACVMASGKNWLDGQSGEMPVLGTPS